MEKETIKKWGYLNIGRTWSLTSSGTFGLKSSGVFSKYPDMVRDLIWQLLLILSFWLFSLSSALADSPPKINLSAEPITPTIHSIPEFIQSILHIVLQIGIPVAAFFLLYSGFLFLTAQGNDTKLTSAKNAFLWAVIGTAVLFGSWLLANAIVGTIAQIGGPTG